MRILESSIKCGSFERKLIVSPIMIPLFSKKYVVQLTQRPQPPYCGWGIARTGRNGTRDVNVQMHHQPPWKGASAWLKTAQPSRYTSEGGSSIVHDVLTHIRLPTNSDAPQCLHWCCTMSRCELSIHISTMLLAMISGNQYLSYLGYLELLHANQSHFYCALPMSMGSF